MFQSSTVELKNHLIPSSTGQTRNENENAKTKLKTKNQNGKGENENEKKHRSTIKQLHKETPY